MNYTYSKAIENVYSFDFFENRLIWLSNDANNPLLKKIKTEAGVLDFAGSIHTTIFFVLKESIYCNIATGGGLLVNINERLAKMRDFLILKISEDKHFGLFRLDGDDGKKYGLMNMDNLEMMWVSISTVRYNLFLDDLLILEECNFETGSIIYCYSKKGELIWEKPVLDTLGKQILINSIVGHDDEQVYVTGVNDEMIAFNIIDGNETILFKYNPALRQSIVVKELHKIIGLGYKVYWEFDLKKKEIVEYDFTAEFKSLQVEILVTSQINKIGNKLFFSSNFLGGDRMKTRRTPKIGAFDIIEKKITWLHEFDFEEGRVIKSPVPIIFENKLFVLDSKNTLHIFEEQLT